MKIKNNDNTQVSEANHYPLGGDVKDRLVPYSPERLCWVQSSWLTSSLWLSWVASWQVTERVPGRMDGLSFHLQCTVCMSSERRPETGRPRAPRPPQWPLARCVSDRSLKHGVGTCHLWWGRRTQRSLLRVTLTYASVLLVPSGLFCGIRVSKHLLSHFA